MMLMKQDLLNVDWSKVPQPTDDGKTNHLIGMALPQISLTATNGEQIDLSTYKDYTVVFVYPRTGQPGLAPLLDNWNEIPGALGCTPQSCSFRDNFTYFKQHKINVFGMSVQDTAYQNELVQRLHLPYQILSDDKFQLTNYLRLPTFQAGQIKLLKRMSIIIHNGNIKHVIYPVFPPDKNAALVIEWFQSITENK